MKTKKKLLIAMAAMSVAAIGAGTVSTFAWFGASAAAKAATSNGNGTITVTKTVATVDAVQIPLTVTVSDDNMANLVLAEYVASPDTNPHLASGYIDDAGGWHAVAAASVKDVFGDDKVLNSTVDVTVAIDFSDSGWSGSAGDRTFSDGTNSYSEATIIELLQSAKVNVGLKATGSAPTTEKSGRLYETTAASGNPYNHFSASADANGYYSILTNQSLAGLGWDGSAIDEDATVAFSNLSNYYVFGGAHTASGNTADSTDISVTNIYAQITAYSA